MFEYFFYEGHDSRHLRLKHSPPSAYVTTHYLDLHFPPSCEATFPNTSWTFTRESLSILNFTSLKLNSLFFQSVYYLLYENQHCSTLQNLTPSLSRALCNCPGPFPSSLPFCCCIDPSYFFPMTGITSKLNAFLAWSHFKHCQSPLLTHGSPFIPALPLPLDPQWLGMEHFPQVSCTPANPNPTFLCSQFVFSPTPMSACLSKTSLKLVLSPFPYSFSPVSSN